MSRFDLEPDKVVLPSTVICLGASALMVAATLATSSNSSGALSRASDFVFQGVMALPYHIYVVSSKIPQNEYTERVQYGAACILLLLVFAIALASIVLRERTRKRLSW